MFNKKILHKIRWSLDYHQNPAPHDAPISSWDKALATSTIAFGEISTLTSEKTEPERNPGGAGTVKNTPTFGGWANPRILEV